ncbi:MAG: DNA polymerase III subunit [Candidatus Omnitrophica bacterium]|nr:DNA polymerase III subunit [Candidatus Omnitrophota bacterium]
MLLDHDFQQDEALKHLTNAYAQSTLSTSYLFSGAHGLGKKELALELGCMVNCVTETFEHGCPCNSCRKIREGIHPDLRILGDDLQERSIKIKDVREAQTWLHFKPYEGTYKILIIRDAERMTTEAQNAFLKTLEEPPAHSIIILTVSNSLLLLPTILSRVTEIRLRPFTSDSIKAHLERQYGLTGEGDFIAYLSGGSYEKAKMIVESGVMEERNKILQHFCARTIFTYLKEFESSSYRGLQEKLKVVLDVIAFIIRDLLAIVQNGTCEFLINSDYREQLTVIAQSSDARTLVTILDDIRDIQSYIDKNVNAKMIVTSLMVIMGKVVG